jgi:hypothetical protein
VPPSIAQEDFSQATDSNSSEFEAREPEPSGSISSSNSSAASSVSAACDIVDPKYPMLQGVSSYQRALRTMQIYPAWLSYSKFDYLRLVPANNVFGHSSAEDNRTDRVVLGTSLYDVINFAIIPLHPTPTGAKRWRRNIHLVL